MKIWGKIEEKNWEKEKGERGKEEIGIMGVK